MARPITWQDVAAPNQAGNLAAAAAASAGLQRSISGLGEVAGDIRATQQAEATKAAVADIMASGDPTAALAAAPQNWAVDPLAVAQAAQNRTGVLQQERQRDAAIAASAAATDASLAATELSRNELQDRRDRALGAELAQPWLNEVNNGTFKGIPDDAFAGKGQGGIYAQEAVQRAIKDKKEYDLRLANLRVQQDQLKLTQAQRDAQNQMAAFMASPAGTGADAVTIRREAERIAKATGAGAAFAVPLATQIGTDAYRGSVSNEELTAPSPTGLQYQKPVAALQAKNSQLESEFNAAISQFDVATAAVTAMGQNDYKDVSPGAINSQFLKNNPQTGDGLLAVDWDVKDVQQRRDYQAKLASREAEGVARELGIDLPKGFTPLTPAQEANLVELTIGTYAGVTGTSDGWGSDSDAAAALRKSYIAYNLFGGQAQIDKQKADLAQSFQTQIGKNNDVIRQVGAAARTGGEIPKAALDVYALTDEAREAAAVADAAAKAERDKWSFVEDALKRYGK